jgi:hypothetical protein
MTPDRSRSGSPRSIFSGVVRPFRPADREALVTLWTRVFCARRTEGVVAFYRALGYAVEQRVSMGRVLG